KKEQNFDWIKKNQPYRSNLDVFWIKHFNTKVFKKQNDINLLIEKLEKMLVDFGLFLNDDSNKMSKKLNYLLALKPQKKDENALD
ncbi:site-specific DNA-methyltransferase, partial [Mycoplasma flocculare]|nr:site-specific DNA-methyltransferase [Mesomycoplasma flocculare]